jgi:hypothetical protein
MYHFLLTEEDQTNIDLLKKRYLQRSGVSLSTAELFRTLLRTVSGEKQ